MERRLMRDSYLTYDTTCQTPQSYRALVEIAATMTIFLGSL